MADKSNNKYSKKIPDKKSEKGLNENSSLEKELSERVNKKESGEKGSDKKVSEKEVVEKEPDKKTTTEYDEEFARVVDTEEIRQNDYNLNIKLYIPDLQYVNQELLETPLKDYIQEWKKSKEELEKATKEMDEAVQEVVKNE